MENALVQNKVKERSTDLDLSIDPLTGECLASRTETAKLANIKEDSDTLEEINKDDSKGAHESDAEYKAKKRSGNRKRNQASSYTKPVKAKTKNCQDPQKFDNAAQELELYDDGKKTKRAKK